MSGEGGGGGVGGTEADSVLSEGCGLCMCVCGAGCRDDDVCQLCQKRMASVLLFLLLRSVTLLRIRHRT